MADVKCQMQQGIMVDEKWCELAQYHDIYGNCKRNRGDMESRYQRQKREEWQKRANSSPNPIQKEADDESYQ